MRIPDRVAIDASTCQGDRAYQQDAAGWRDDPSLIVAAVADGMGSGSGSGRIASTAVMLALNILNTYGEQPSAAIAATSDCVRDLTGHGRGENDDTTLVLAAIETCGDVHVAWVGDSRAYVLTRSGRLHQLTKDHNLGPYRPNTLTRALLGPELDHRHHAHGANCQQHSPEAAEYSNPFDPPVMVVLMTDGVCGALTEEDIRRLLESSGDDAQDTDRDHRTPATRAASRLTAFAVRAARAKDDGLTADNATALVIDLAESLAAAR